MKKSYWNIWFAGTGLLVLILDTKTAIVGMREGIKLCLQTLIPSLFPFMMLCILLTSSLLGRKIPLIGRLGRHLGMPAGAESIFIVGLLGGYPVGAQCVAQAVDAGHISREKGERMLAFCSNAGPAFLFGLGTRLFPYAWQCWVLWAIHIISAIVVGLLTPGKETESGSIAEGRRFCVTTALRKSIETMAQICGWVVIFRVILAFCQRWFLWLLPQQGQLLFCGLLELANGCCALAQVAQLETRFVLFSLFLGFGGLCVAMQTRSVCTKMNISWYLWEKMMQAAVSFLLATAFISREMRLPGAAALVTLCFAYYFGSRKFQNSLAFSRKQVYNEENCKRGNYHAISQKDRTPMRLLFPQHAAERRTCPLPEKRHPGIG